MSSGEGNKDHEPETTADVGRLRLNDELCDFPPDGYIMESAAAEMVVKKMSEIAVSLRRMAGGDEPVPDSLRRVPYVAMSAIADWIDPPRFDCISCEDGSPAKECAESQLPCGHHCNHSWSHDACCWCGAEFGDDA